MSIIVPFTGQLVTMHKYGIEFPIHVGNILADMLEYGNGSIDRGWFFRYNTHIQHLTFSWLSLMGMLYMLNRNISKMLLEEGHVTKIL